MSRKLLVLITLALIFLPLLTFALTATSDVEIISGDFPSTPGDAPVYGTGGLGPLAIIVNLYRFALMIGGGLAFAMILWGGIKYLTSGGSHHAEGEAKDIIRDAFLGLLLLAGAYLVLMIVNPDLTRLQLPFLERLEPPPAASSSISLVPPGTGEWGMVEKGGQWSPAVDVTTIERCFPDQATCETYVSENLSAWVQLFRLSPTYSVECIKTDQCKATIAAGGTAQCERNQELYKKPEDSCKKNSPLLTALKDCVTQKSGNTLQSGYTYNGNHNINSCHFGGKTCTDGSHAIDYGIQGSAVAGFNLQQVQGFIDSCETEVASLQGKVGCFYEDSSGNRNYSWNNPAVNHIHCNVDKAACGCN